MTNTFIVLKYKKYLMLKKIQFIYIEFRADYYLGF